MQEAEQRPRENKKYTKARFFFRRLSVWFVISLILQIGALVYLNHWLTGSGKAKETIISSMGKQKIKNKESYKFQSIGNVTSYSVSYDAKFIAFVDDEGLKIYNLADKKEVYNMAKDQEKAHDPRTNKEINYPQGITHKVEKLKWLPDRNKLMYVYQWESYKSGPVNLDVYICDVNGANKMRVAHFDGRPKGTSIKNIALSTMTNLINIQVETPYKTTQLYQVDIMSSMKQLGGSGKEVGAIAVAPRDGSLFAEIYTRTNYPPKISLIRDWSVLDVFSGDKNYRLLGVDGEGKLYLGEESVTGINSIYVATVKTETKSYTKTEEIPDSETKKQNTVIYTDIKSKDINKLMDLSSTVLPEKIYIHNDGDIIIDSGSGDNQVTLYHNGLESKKIEVPSGPKEILLYNKYLAVLKQTTKENEITIYNINK